VLAQAAEPPQHVRDVAAEDAAQRVQLVDDHVAQAHQEGRPALVRRQDADVQHLGVGQQDVGVLACPSAGVAVGVAVVGDRPQSADEPGPERPELVLRERLGREHQQRRVTPTAHDRFDDRHLVAERLAGRRARRDDDAAARPETVDGGRLVRVEALDASRGEARADLLVERLARICEARRPCGDRLPIHEAARRRRIRSECVERGARVHAPPTVPVHDRHI
jgi:hypothetical protein